MNCATNNVFAYVSPVIAMRELISEKSTSVGVLLETIYLTVVNCG